MEKFSSVSAVAAPLMRTNVNTDVIIRIERLISLERNELGPYAFEAWRYRPDGTPDPEFVLNQDRWRDAKILVCGDNFGCGSSREGAVWALAGIGIRAVIGTSFGDIFFNNCFQNGVLPVVLPPAQVEQLAREVAASANGAPTTIDLEAQEVVGPSGTRYGFTVDPLRRRALLEGLDDIGVTLTREADIAAFQSRDRAARPWVYP
jgi:3-isopropylmalate/(R)-2-methylmalate dehydratase small subunit